MADLAKTVFIILAIGFTVFHFAKKAFAEHIPEGDFKKWLWAWLLITSAAFFTGNFPAYMLISVVIMYYFSRKIDNRIAYFLILYFAFPPYQVLTPVIYVSHWRILSLVILLPMFFSKKWRRNTPSLGKPLGDKLIILMLILMFILNLRGTTPGDSIRTSVTFFIDWLLPYFVVSRCIKDFDELKTALIALTIGCTIAACIALFEYLTVWLLYQPLPFLLNFDSLTGSYLGRAGQLRALASMGHSLTLGLVLLVMIGINIPLSSLVQSKWLKRGYLASLFAGLYSTVSRGPWGATGIVILVYTITGRKAMSRTVLLLASFALAIFILPSIPGGQRIINMMPFIGQSEQFNVEYREQLIPKSIQILKRSPLFGVFDAREEPEMEDMKQGEGIVDIVNSYLNIALSYGLVGLTIFLWIFVWTIYQIIRAMKYIRDRESLRYKLGQSLRAIYVGLLVMLSSISFVDVVGSFVFLLLGLSASYSRIMMDEFRERLLNQSR